MADHRILIVEDEPLISYVIRRYLNQQGFEVAGIASRVNEAIGLAQTCRPDLILMDIFLNDTEDGIYAAEQIRKFSDVPVIYLSAFSDTETLERAKATNPSGFLVKPIDERELLTNIPIAIHKYEADKKIKEIEQQLRKFSVVVEQSPVSIIITDKDGNIEYANSKFSKVSGYDLADVIGKNPRFLKSGETCNAEYKKMWDLLKSGQEWKGEFHNKKKNGELYWENATITPIINSEGTITNFVALKEETTGVKIVENSLIESEDRYRRLVEMSPDMIAIHCDGKLVYVNDASVKFAKANSKEDLLGKSAMDFVHPSSIEIVKNRIFNMLSKKIMVPFTEEIFIDIKGNAVEVETAAIATTFRGKPAIQVIVRDISERKKREEQVKKSLHEKEILLKEIHHRVKNNLQIISSLLNLQSEQIEDERALALFNDSRNRVKSMALIHERLYQSHDLANVDFAEYINELSRFLYRTYVTNEQKVSIKVDTENIFLSIDTAIPCGLIINELLSNALKYAFPDLHNGLVEVIFKDTGDARYELIVKDNGVGLPGDLDFRNTVSLGLQLVVSLVQQIKGEIELDRCGGSRFIVKFSAR